MSLDLSEKREMEDSDPRTRREKKRGTGGATERHKDLYNQKSIRIQERLREKSIAKKGRS
jgi:hypothetical protein